jgi:hypothetical protein
VDVANDGERSMKDFRKTDFSLWLFHVQRSTDIWNFFENQDGFSNFDVSSEIDLTEQPVSMESRTPGHESDGISHPPLGAFKFYPCCRQNQLN